MAEQLALDFPCQTAFGAEDYFVSDANKLAAGLVEDWENWPEKRLLLLGPNGAGKTHLARVWAGQAGATFIDVSDLDEVENLRVTAPCVLENLETLPRVYEQNLFHLLNLYAQSDQYILLTGRGTIASWGINLPDLQSRLQQIVQAEIEAPDDTLLLAVLMKLFQDRQLNLPPNVLSYISTRMPRSFEAVNQLVTRMDKQSLATGGAVNMKLAREVIAELSQS